MVNMRVMATMICDDLVSEGHFFSLSFTVLSNTGLREDIPNLYEVLSITPDKYPNNDFYLG
jgi:hypothetical protein